MPDPRCPGRRVGRLVASPQELILAQQSCYCVFPYNLVLRDILKENKPTLVIGLPCHLQGLQQACVREPRLAELVRYRISLFCGHNVTFQATRHAATQCGVDVDDPGLAEIRYREGSYPGAFMVHSRGQPPRTLPLSKFRALIPSTVLRRCLLCMDGTGTCADISCGDIYGFGEARTCVLVRNEKGTELCRHAADTGRLIVESMSMEDARKGVVGYMERHHLFWPLAVNRVMMRLGRSSVYVPESCSKRLVMRDMVDGIVHYLMVMLMQSTPARFLFAVAPSWRFSCGAIVGFFPGWKWYRAMWRLIGKVNRARGA